MEEKNRMIEQLKGLGVDFEASEFAASSAENAKAQFVDEVDEFIHSLDFMRLGQAVSHGQWQSAGMKVAKMSAKAKSLGCVGLERQFAGIRGAINRRNSEEALHILALIITKRVRIVTFYQNVKSENTKALFYEERNEYEEK